MVSRAGDALPGGGVTPGRHDGTGAFPAQHGGVLLVQNHENGTSGPNPALAAPELTYDSGGLGGTTTLTLTLDKHTNGGDAAHIVCSFARTSDGSAADHNGQVWAYDPEGQTLTLELYLPVNPDPASDQPDGPDNITVSPYGGFFLAEDRNGVQHLLSVDEDGNVKIFARNRLSDSEFTGVNFSPDGRTLFANIQDQGLCFAITGPFKKLD